MRSNIAVGWLFAGIAICSTLFASHSPALPVTSASSTRPSRAIEPADPLVPAAPSMTFTVINANDLGIGSLRQAIMDANTNAGADLINFNIPGAGAHIINLASALPAIIDPVTIDATTQPAGTIELNGSGAGVANGLILTSSTNVIRGLRIGGFSDHGIIIDIGGNNIIEGNLIGVANPNGRSGIFMVGSANNTIGGLSAASRNVISNNGEEGVIDLSGTGNHIIGNFIGTDVTGAAAAPNGANGVRLDGASGAIVGGTAAGARNVISGNSGNGIFFIMGANGNTVQGNLIGTAGDGASPVGNLNSGVLFADDFSSNNLIGGIVPGAGNTIAFNAGGGIRTQSGTGNTFIRNSIFSNPGAQIDLNFNGPTPNDNCDPDTGSNNLQNFPGLDAVMAGGGSVVIQGVLDSTPGIQYRLDFYAGSTCGDAQAYLGTANVTTGASCLGTFDVTLPAAVAPGQFVTATATDPSGNTSELSTCAPVLPAACILTCVPTQAAIAEATACGAKVAYAPPETNGTCGTITCDPPPGSFFAAGVTTVTCVAGVGPTCSFTLNVIDRTPPSLACPNNVVAGVAPGQQTKRVDFPNPAVSDNCSQPIVECAPPSGSQFPLGTTTVSCRARDDAFNEGACIFTVRVSDSAPPTIACPPNAAVTAPATQNFAVVTYPAPVVTDDQPGATASCSPASGGAFPLGVTTVTCTATDTSGNTATCMFNVTVTGGPNLVVVNIPGGKPSIEFQTQTPRRKKAKNLSCELFSIQNSGRESVEIRFAAVTRTAPNLDRLSNRDDTSLFLVSAVNSDQSRTPLDLGARLTLAAGQQRNFCVSFNPLVPRVRNATAGLASVDVIPDRIDSSILFTTGSGGQLNVPLVGRVFPNAIFINPDKPKKAAVFSFEKSGNSFFVEFSSYDPNRDTRSAKYEFLDSKQESVETIDISLTDALSKLTPGQSFSVRQEFSGARDHSEVASVRLTISDGDGTVSASIPLGTSSSSAAQLPTRLGSGTLSVRPAHLRTGTVRPPSRTGPTQEKRATQSGRS